MGDRSMDENIDLLYGHAQAGRFAVGTPLACMTGREHLSVVLWGSRHSARFQVEIGLKQAQPAFLLIFFLLQHPSYFELRSTLLYADSCPWSRDGFQHKGTPQSFYFFCDLAWVSDTRRLRSFCWLSRLDTDRWRILLPHFALSFSAPKNRSTCVCQW